MQNSQELIVNYREISSLSWSAVAKFLPVCYTGPYTVQKNTENKELCEPLIKARELLCQYWLASKALSDKRAKTQSVHFYPSPGSPRSLLVCLPESASYLDALGTHLIPLSLLIRSPLYLLYFSLPLLILYILYHDHCFRENLAAAA